MSIKLRERILASVSDTESLYHKLIIVVGSAATGKTEALNALSDEKGWPMVNVNLSLSQRLLELTVRQRALRVAALLEDVVRETEGDVVLLDNIELLFSHELEQDPLRLLQGMSRHRPIIAAWPGASDNRTLSYAKPGHPETRRYTNPEAVLVTAGD